MVKSLLDNAVQSIEIGVADFQSEDERRLLSAVRNIYAGVLLLCKQVLWTISPQESDGVLIYKRIVPKLTADGALAFERQGKSKQTVDRLEIEERFQSLGLSLDWKKLRGIAEIRNEIEHFHTEKPNDLVKEVLADAMPLIVQLITEHLEEKPEDLFDAECWKSLLQNQKVFEEQTARCAESFSKVHWLSSVLENALEHLRCTECGSSLVEQNEPENTDQRAIELRCISCNTQLDRIDVLETALDDATVGETYVAIKDGGDPPIAPCPECARSGFVREEDHCVLCDFDGDMTCGLCGSSVEPEDYNAESGMCSYCNYKMDKVMDD